MKRKYVGIKSGVGRSTSRTPFKHFLLSALLGREGGIYARCPHKVHARAVPWHIIDMNAGDGRPSSEGDESSPALIVKHARIAAGCGVRVKATLIERAEATYQVLRENVQPEPFIEFIHGDAREYRVPAHHRHQAIFVHTDPNHIGDWCVSRELIDSFSQTTTLLATLGCNVAGLKRLPRAERQPWFDHVSSITASMPRYHDAILFAIDRDSSQWAYLVRLPREWTERTIGEAKSGAGRCGLELRIASWQSSAVEFDNMQRELFLTRSEKEGGGNEQAGA